MLPKDGAYCKVEGVDYGFTPPLFDMLSLQFVNFIFFNCKENCAASLWWLSGDAFGVWVVLNS